MGRPTPAEAVVRVHSRLRLVPARALHVRGAGHDQLVDWLQASAVLDELVRQPLQQLGVSRRLAPAAEIARRRYNALAQVMLPEPINNNAGQQVAGAAMKVRQPFGERPPPVRRSPTRRRLLLP